MRAAPDDLALRNGALAGAREFLTAFGVATWQGYRVFRHVEKIAAALEAVKDGQLDRLIIEAPRQHGKTLTASWLFPVWWLGHRPTDHVLATTFSQDRADDSGRKVKHVIESDSCRAVFPHVQLDPSSHAVSRFDLTAGGSYRGVGRGGTVTGRPGSVLIIDDLIKDKEEAGSPAVQEACRDFFQYVLYPTRRPKAPIVGIWTRWGENDFGGWILREHKDDGWHVLCLRAIAEDADDPLGRELGEPLCPEMYDLAELARIRQAIGERAFLALYQQRPTPPSGRMFAREWWRFYDARPPLDSFEVIIHAWDLNLKKTTGGSFAVGQVWGQRGPHSYLLDQVRVRVDFVEVVARMEWLARAWPASAILVEDAAAGPPAIAELRRRFPNVIGIPPKGSKEQRAAAVAPMVEAGSVYLPSRAIAPWIEAFIEEASAFPQSEHNDQVDAMAHALARLSSAAGCYSIGAPADDAGGDLRERGLFVAGEDSGWP